MTRVHGFIEKLAELSQQGKPFASVTMVASSGSVPQEAGSKMLVDQSGLVFGTVGGGRVEEKAIATAQELLRQPPTAASTLLAQWNLKRDVGMTCGGTVTLYFEAINHRVWPIYLFGAGHVANALTHCLTTLDCKLTVIDSRQTWLDKLPQSDRLTAVHMVDPVGFVSQLPEGAFVLLMTMGHRTDRPILQAIFACQLQLSYLGVIGSRAKRAVLRKELLEAGIDESFVENFRCPIGLPLGTNEPQEIAISVTAELIQVRDSLRANVGSNTNQHAEEASHISAET